MDVIDRRDLIDHGPWATRRGMQKTDDGEQQRHGGRHYHYAEQFHACASD